MNQHENMNMVPYEMTFFMDIDNGNQIEEQEKLNGGNDAFDVNNEKNMTLQVDENNQNTVGYKDNSSTANSAMPSLKQAAKKVCIN